MQFTFCPLFSGSSGNAVYVRAGDTRLLIDAGLSGRTVSEGLASIGVLPETLSGILVTHEHSDHIKGVGILSRKYHVPIYANDRTWQAMERSLGNIAPGSRRVFESGETFYIGNAGIMPYRISHDAAEPVGYRVYYGGHSVATATDIGVFTKKTLEALSGTDIVLLESNHDIDMLHANDHYSAQLKARILGRYGHLSNEACGEALLQLYQTGVRHAVLGHLSHENNTPELAMSTVCGVLRAHGLEPSEDIQVDMAWRDHVGGVYEIIEPITPFLSRARDLYEQAGISTILVAGSSGAFFHIADTVIQMDRYKPVDITKKAKALCKEFPISEEKPHPFALPHSHRIMEKDKNGATKRRDYRSGAVRKNEPERLKLKTMGTDGFAIGKQTVDLRYLEQLIDSEQTACLGMLLKYAVEHLVDGKRTIAEVVVQLQKELETSGMRFLAENGIVSGGYAMPRVQEMYSCFNRYRV